MAKRLDSNSTQAILSGYEIPVLGYGLYQVCVMQSHACESWKSTFRMGEDDELKLVSMSCILGLDERSLYTGYKVAARLSKHIPLL
ncbi:Aldo/keto reductase subgroup [Penicillium brevicompactum]|uniref:Aldo/keto reductase subgroup n=1 Tax=Penicillium brevicompactum TaxID=5074 RepID=A0A9W9Q4G7_PENBR|nr:Aldo/keto reductase subgroup [Penicillium brevicompactum]